MLAHLIITTVVALAPAGTIPVPASPSAIAVGGGSVWALAGNRLVQINPRTNTVSARIDAGVRVGSERTCDLAVAGGLVWMIGTKNGSRSLVVRVDARSGRPLGSTSLPFAACVVVLTFRMAVWSSAGTLDVRRLVGRACGSPSSLPWG